jgi:hypothetical protein
MAEEFPIIVVPEAAYELSEDRDKWELRIQVLVP